LASFLALAAITQAADYYVDCNAGSGGNGGQSSPWNAISQVNEKTFSGGDNVYFKRGCIFSSNNVNAMPIKTTSSSSSQPVIFTAYGNGNNPEIRNVSTDQWAKGIIISGNYVVLENLKISGAKEKGINIEGGYNTVRNCEITDVGIDVNLLGQSNTVTKSNIHDLKMVVNTQGGDDDDYDAVAFKLGGTNNEISYNTIRNCWAPSYDYTYDGGAVEIYSSANNARIHHNYVTNTQGFLEGGSNNHSDIINNVTVAYNVIENSGRVVGIHLGGSFAISINNFKFTNNTVIDTKRVSTMAFYLSDDTATSSMFILRNNIFYLPGYSKFFNLNGSITHDHNLFYGITSYGYSLSSTESNTDPSFANLSDGDYHLLSSSKAIDTGITADYSSDFDGKTVPSGNAPDLGAYEFNAAPNEPSPTNPVITPTNTSLSPTQTLSPTIIISPTPTPDPCRLQGDVDCSGTIDIKDFMSLASQYQGSAITLSIIVANFGRTLH